LDYDAIWDAWAATGHDDCGGYMYKPAAGVIRCACGELIPLSPEQAMTDA
jgi:hypothetical protein